MQDGGRGYPALRCAQRTACKHRHRLAGGTCSERRNYSWSSDGGPQGRTPLVGPRAPWNPPTVRRVTYDSGEVGYLVVAALTLHLPNRSLVDRRSDETLSSPGPALMAGPVQFFSHLINSPGQSARQFDHSSFPFAVNS